MKYYKEEILSKLHKTGWELVERDDDTDWWLEEWWLIKSVKQVWGLKLFIHFQVDLHYEGNKKSSAVWLVSANLFKADGYIEVRESIAELPLQSGRFDENINKFIAEINEFRNTNT